jgi:hypothetical protein
VDQSEAGGQAPVGSADAAAPGVTPIGEPDLAIPDPAEPLGPDPLDATEPVETAAPMAMEPVVMDPVVATPVPVWGPVVPPPDDGSPPPAEAARGTRWPGWSWAVVAVVAALIGAVVGGGIVAATTHADNAATVKEISAGPALLNGVTNIEAVIGKVLPAIVSIDAKSSSTSNQSILG